MSSIARGSLLAFLTANSDPDGDSFEPAQPTQSQEDPEDPVTGDGGEPYPLPGSTPNRSGTGSLAG